MSSELKIKVIIKNDISDVIVFERDGDSIPILGLQRYKGLYQEAILQSYILGLINGRYGTEFNISDLELEEV